MFTLKGKYNTATVFTDNIEQEAISQIINMLNQYAFRDSRVRIMPDVHAGKGCTVGTTMTITDKVVPNLVGSDIGCGMEVAFLGKVEIDFALLDEIIRKYIPSGFTIRGSNHRLCDQIDLSQLRCCGHINEMKSLRSLGTLGGGNHFIEVDRNDQGEYYLVIHSGSRHLGTEVAKYYQEQACKMLEASQETIPEDFAHCEGNLFDDYIHDMKIVQLFSVLNRKAMLEEIVSHLGIEVIDSFTTIHNYIDTDNMILRKGAVSAKKGERLIIPINMRDGSLICTGKGNADWNFSAPHGAGRLMSRSAAKAAISLEEYRESMKGIFTTSVGTSTIDESPMAYKPIEDIVDNIGDTVEIDEIISPVYNFKAGN